MDCCLLPSDHGLYDRCVTCAAPALCRHRDRRPAGFWSRGVRNRASQARFDGHRLHALLLREQQIDFIFCDLPPLLKLSCGDSYTQEVVIIVFAVLSPCPPVYWSSRFPLRVHRPGRRADALLRGAGQDLLYLRTPTCAAVALFFGTLIFMYLRDSSGQSSGRTRWCPCSTRW